MAIQMGPATVADPAALLRSLGSQQPAQNSKTPLERLNPEKQLLEKVMAASFSVSQAQEYTNDQNVILALNAIHGVLTKILMKFDGVEVLNAYRDAISQFPPPVAPGMGAAPGSPGAPGAPQGGPPAATAGMPSQPPSPGPAPGVPPQ